jgi:small subunit ribosomal protein S6
MFLFDPAFANEGDNVQKELDRILERAGAKLIGMSRWEERKLAYEIKKRKRGVHVVTYFHAPPESIRGIERDVQLSDSILRVLVLRADHLSEEQMQQPVPSPSEASRRFGDDWSGPGRGGRGGRDSHRGGRGGEGRGERRRDSDRDRDEVSVGAGREKSTEAETPEADSSESED